MMNVGMDYDRSLFGMKLSDCRSLAKALERTETLTYLNLSGNLLDDEKVHANNAARRCNQYQKQILQIP
jgi:hypothetical protein